MNILIQAAGASLKGGISAYLALAMAASPVQTAQVQNVADLAVKGDKQEYKLEISESRPTVQSELLKICQDRGYGEACAKHLLGMLWKESNNIATAIGDDGQARGYFQIWYKLHKIPIACAENLHCSANWTINYLESNGYPRYVHHAVQCHNGCNIDNGYAASAIRHGHRLWNQPLPLSSGRIASR